MSKPERGRTERPSKGSPPPRSRSQRRSPRETLDMDTENDAMIARMMAEQYRTQDSSRTGSTSHTSSVESDESEQQRRKRRSSSSQQRRREADNTSTEEQQPQQSVGNVRKYDISELISSLDVDDSSSQGLPPALERRIRDFKFARNKRMERHGEQRPWGIFGLYAHLSDIRSDLEWAEDAAWRRQNNEPYLSWTDFEKKRDVGLKNRPLFTYMVVLICTVMMVVSIAVNDWKIEPLSVNPLFGPSSETLIQIGARQTSLIVNEGEWHRLFTPMFLHAGFVHYIINMLALWYVGGAVEMSHGFANAAILFTIPAVGGTILSSLFLPQYISVGASGGIFGLIGGCLADIAINWDLLFLKTTTDEDSRWRHLMVLFWLFLDVVVNCMLGMTPFIDNFSHLGGFIYGVCCGLSTIERLAVGFFSLTNGKYSYVRNTIVRFLGLIVSVVAIMVTTILLAQSDGTSTPCNACRYVSCVPFPPNAEEKWWYCDDCDFVSADLFQATDGSGLYTDISLSCPSGEIEDIIILDEGFTDREKVRRKLPKYCRMFCDDVFNT